MSFHRDVHCISGCPGTGRRPRSRRAQALISEMTAQDRNLLRFSWTLCAAPAPLLWCPGPLCEEGREARQRADPVWHHVSSSDAPICQDRHLPWPRLPPAPFFALLCPWGAVLPAGRHPIQTFRCDLPISLMDKRRLRLRGSSPVGDRARVRTEVPAE